MADRYEKLCLAALKDLKVEWIVWIVGKVIRFMIRLFSLCCPSQWSCPTSKGIRTTTLPDLTSRRSNQDGQMGGLRPNWSWSATCGADAGSDDFLRVWRKRQVWANIQNYSLHKCTKILDKTIIVFPKYVHIMYYGRGHCSHLRSWWETECGFH